MAFCSKCGTTIADGVGYCPQCGAPASGGVAVAPPPAVPAASGLRENVAGLLCYVLGWVTGIIFLLIDKRPFVRFHAAQSIVVFGTLNLLRVVLTFGFVGIHFMGMYSIWSLISMLVSVVTLVAWVVLMVTAWQGKKLEVPIAAGFAKSIAGSAAA